MRMALVMTGAVAVATGAFAQTLGGRPNLAIKMGIGGVGANGQSSIQTRMAQAGVTARDLDAMRSKIRMVTAYLQGAWHDMFLGSPLQSRPPVFRPYLQALESTGCGPVPVENAAYCRADHTIYYDEIFLASEMKAAGASLRTDGDFAPITILSHEFGHAVAIQTGRTQQPGLYAENAADCMAGVIAARARREGHLDPGDEQEAFFAISRAVDPSGFGGPRDPRAHGNLYQRTASFVVGLNTGDVLACVRTR